MSCSNSLLFTCSLVLVFAHYILASDEHCTLSSDEDYGVPFTPVLNATERRAVCMDGSAAGYYHAAGSGDGAKNWLVYLMGGGWCDNKYFCRTQSRDYHGTTTLTPTNNLTGILSGHQDINPDFYKWNRIYVYYCDQSSFLGDTEFNGPEENMQYRGSKIFDAVIEDLLEKGMKDADNAMLAGQSAGALAAIVHCDGFRASLPNVARVKCFADSGFFLRAKDLPASGAKHRDEMFGSIVKHHNLSSFLPTSCTKRMDPSLCLFPENIVGDIQTPLFLLNPAFDSYQIEQMLVAESDSKEIWDICRKGFVPNNNCTATTRKLINEYGKTLVQTVMDLPENPSRGIYINNCYSHVFSMNPSDSLWTPHSTLRLGKNKENMLEAVGNWYFDRNSVYIIDNTTQSPQQCNVYV